MLHHIAAHGQNKSKNVEAEKSGVTLVNECNQQLVDPASGYLVLLWQVQACCNM